VLLDDAADDEVTSIGAVPSEALAAEALAPALSVEEAAGEVAAADDDETLEKGDTSGL